MENDPPRVGETRPDARDGGTPADPGPAGELAPVTPGELASDPRRLAAVLATVLDQQSRDAAANRAQARELIRAVDGLSKAHEFLGLELRDERRRSRLLLAGLVFVPVAVIVAGALLVRRASDDADRVSHLEREIAAVRDRNDLARVADVRSEYESRLAGATDDARATREEQETMRRALDAERAATAEKLRAAEARVTAADRDRAEVSGLRAELTSLRDRASAEKARADELTRLLATAAASRREAQAPTGVPAPAGATAAPGVPATPTAPAPTGSADGAPAASPAKSAPPAPPRVDAAVRDPGDLDRIRRRLNSLLETGTGAARYEFEALGGVSGTDLLQVRVVGRDESGRTLRAVEAQRAEIVVGPDGVRVRFADGHLLVGGRRAPFFDGAYTIAVDGAPTAWRSSGLTCLRVESP